MEQIVQRASDWSRGVVVVRRSLQLPPAAPVERLRVELHALLGLAMRDAKETAGGAAVLVGEEAGWQELRKASAHRVPRHVRPPAAPKHAARASWLQELADNGPAWQRAWTQAQR